MLIVSCYVASVFLSLFWQIEAQSYLWDLNLDPTETENLYDSEDYADRLAYLTERLSYWQDQVIAGDSTDSSDPSYTSAWETCGGICPWVDNTYSLDIEQIYFPGNPPNIIFVLVDDWGWNDIGFRSTYMNWTTPTIDKLAEEGIIFDNYFTHSFCVPSRAALMTGRFAGRLGMLEDMDGNELPLSEVTLAQELKSAGYRTHMVGKWHLGDSSLARLPTYRGFDSFYGYYSGFMDYYTKEYAGYLDLHDGVELASDESELSSSVHAAYLFQSKVESVIQDHANYYPTTPLFLYYAMQLVHFPIEAPMVYKEKCGGSLDGAVDYSTDTQYCALNVMLDEAIANLTCILKETSLLDNTVLIVTSDNGGEGTIAGNSVPFRGHKYDFNRGGIGANAFVTSPLLPESRRGVVYSGQMHVTDWLPTIMSMVTNDAWSGGYSGNIIDGVNMWDAIISDLDSPRTEIAHYANTNGEGSIQIDMIKLDADISPEAYDNVTDYYPKDMAPDNSHYSCEEPYIVEEDVVDPNDPLTPTAAPSHRHHHKMRWTESGEALEFSDDHEYDDDDDNTESTERSSSLPKAETTADSSDTSKQRKGSPNQASHVVMTTSTDVFSAFTTYSSYAAIAALFGMAVVGVVAMRRSGQQTSWPVLEAECAVNREGLSYQSHAQIP